MPAISLRFSSRCSWVPEFINKLQQEKDIAQTAYPPSQANQPDPASEGLLQFSLTLYFLSVQAQKMTCFN
jgi:hypothetical protein